MKKIILIISVILLVGCSEKEAPPEKPFIIIHKYPEPNRCKGGYCAYKYIDLNENTFFFCEDANAYRIGDTIK